MKSPDERFELSRVAAAEWLIRDTRRAIDDPRHVVARIREHDDLGVEVIWPHRSPRDRGWATPFDVLDDLARECGIDRSTKPIEIPHRPPFAPPASPRG